MEVEEFGATSRRRADWLWDMEMAPSSAEAGEIPRWNKVGGDFPYHYLGSPKTMLRIGKRSAMPQCAAKMK